MKFTSVVNVRTDDCDVLIALAKQILDDCKRAEKDTEFVGPEHMIPLWRRKRS